MSDPSMREPERSAGALGFLRSTGFRITAVVVLIAVLLVIVAFDGVTGTDKSSPALAVGGILVTLLAILLTPRRGDEERRVTQSRERVRAAEQGVEDALRVPSRVGSVAALVREWASESNEGSSGAQGDGELLDRVAAARWAHLRRRLAELEAGAGEAAQADDEPGESDPSLSLSSRLALPELWALTHSRLDLYHEIATGQASRSFRNAQVAMVLGFVLLVAFVVVALQASTTAGAVVAGGLGAVAAGLAGYVSRTFVRSQEAAAGHLRAYFDQPLEFSRYLAAERLVADSNLTEEQRAEVVTELAKAMIAGPGGPNADAGNGSNGDTGNTRL
ncbi:hypothetical protein ACOKM3_14270 [Streptomyces sp. BH106]|uniref:hypothetical protein n=1 Tax=Streptomyces sp. BH106 TaxID=3410409 RepID=UPI003CE927A7